MMVMTVETAEAPRSSVTVSVALYVPGSVYVCDGLRLELLVPPSPKSQAKLNVPSESAAVPLKFTVSGPVPDVTFDVAEAVGLSLTSMAMVAVSLTPSPSVTVNVAV